MQGSCRNSLKLPAELENWQSKRLLWACVRLKKPIIPKARKRSMRFLAPKLPWRFGLTEPAPPEGARQEKGA